MNEQKIKDLLSANDYRGLSYYGISKLSSLASAERTVKVSRKAMFIVLGTPNVYFVVDAKNATLLEKLGYEVLKTRKF